ncbi:hypothetical protein [Tropicimonas sp. S265A]|uniref:hypothetical protein n=1 Tax=Tropicimonas sp. S265A TaxID=3415134 RepID=UPI003C7CCA67
MWSALNTFLRNLASVLESLPSNPLAIVSLIVVALGLLAFLFFSREHRWVKLIAFALCLVGGGGIVYVVTRQEVFREDVTENVSPAADKQTSKRIIQDGADCVVLGSSLSERIPLEVGACFVSEDDSAMAEVKRIFQTGVEFSGGLNGPFPCYTDDSCSFGWDGAPTFRVTERAGRMFMIGG